MSVYCAVTSKAFSWREAVANDPTEILTQSIDTGDTLHSPAGDAVYTAFATRDATIAGKADGLQWAVKNADFNAAATGRYQVDTSGGAVTATLPASATAGDSIIIEDAALAFNTHNLTLNRNGLKINSGTSNYVASVNGTKLSCVYISAGIGWSVK